MRSRFCSALLLLLPCVMRAHDPITTNLTWSKEISRIVYKRCAGCHRSSLRAMPLVTYEQARPWAKAIRDEVANRRMPPWGATPGIGEFKGDRSLSTPEIEMLIAWVEGGAPEGDPAFLPTRVPSPERAPALHFTRRSTVARTQRISTLSTLVAIRPRAAADVWAELGDGTVIRLIEVRQTTPFYTRPFIFETPVTLPAGATLHTTGAAILYFR